MVRNRLIDTTDGQHKINHTYEKGDYRAKLDHILIKEDDISKCYTSNIVIDEFDTSDHMPVSATFIYPSKILNHPDQEIHKTHRFAWKNHKFKTTYSKIFKAKIKELRNQFSFEGDVVNTVENNLTKLTKLHIKCARDAENEIEKKRKRHVKSALDFNDNEIQMHANRIKKLSQDPNLSNVFILYRYKDKED